jgi:hypothetical protein
MRAVLLAALVLATVGAGAWYFLLRAEPTSDEFVRAESQYVTAARGYLGAVDGLHTFSGLPALGQQLAAATPVMSKQVAVFERLAGNRSGRAAELARAAATAGTSGVDAALLLYETLKANNIVAVHDQRAKLVAAVHELEADRSQYRKLEQ